MKGMNIHNKSLSTTVIYLLLTGITLIHFNCTSQDSPASTPEDKWIENPELIHEMVAKVDSSRIWRNMLHITSFPSRGNYGTNIDEVREWLESVAIDSGLNFEIHRFLPIGFEIYFASDNVGFMYSNHVDMRTEDGGQSWERIDLPYIKDMFFVDENNGFYTNTNEEKLMATNDAGINWELRKDNMDFRAIYFKDSHHGYILGSNYLYETFDGGSTLQEFASISYAQDIFFLDSSHSWICDFKKVYISKDNWKSWTEVTSGLDDAFLCDIFMLNEKTGWVWESDRNYYRTDDGGLTWRYDAYLNDNEVRFLFGLPPANVWTVTAHGSIIFSSDSGNTWLRTDVGGWPEGIAFTDSLRGWISTKLGIFRTFDGGHTWQSHLDHVPENVTWENVIIEIPGKKYPEKQVLITAHYDALYSEGADDNASGMAALLEIMNILSQYDFAHTIKVVFFSGEEEGLIGSRFYADRSVKQNDDIIAVLNFDVIGYWDEALPRDLNIIYNDDSESLADDCLNVIRQYTDIVAVKNRKFGPRSDHDAFWERDYTAVWFSEAGSRSELSPYINGWDDTIDTIDRLFLYDNIKAAVAAAAIIAIPVEEKQ